MMNRYDPMTVAALGYLGYGGLQAGQSVRNWYGRRRNNVASVRPRRTPYVPKRRRKLMSSIRSRKGKPSVKSLNKKLSRLSQLAESDMGLLTYRNISTAQPSWAANVSANQEWTIGTVAEIETVLGQLRYYNPSAPASLTTANFATGSYQKEVLIDSISLNVKIKSSYDVPIMVHAYECCVKEDTDQTPSAAFTAGLADMSSDGAAVLTSTSLYAYPSDVPLFKDLWSVKSVKKFHINPGTIKTLTLNSGKSFSYDPSLSDTHALSFQRKNHAKVLYLRLFGDIAHDSVNAEVGHQDGKCDIIGVKTYKVKYNAGADIEFVFHSNNLDSFTNNVYTSRINDGDNYQVNST